MWCDLIFDKFAGNHHFQNVLTKDMTVENLVNGKYKYLSDDEAIKYYNKKFKNSYKIPADLSSKFYNITIYFDKQKNIESIYTIVSVNVILLERTIINKKKIPSEKFLKILCHFHSCYSNINSFRTYNSAKADIKIGQNAKYIIDRTMVPIDYTFHSKIDQLKEVTTELFDYQKASIYWMLQLEKNSTKVAYNTNDEVIMGNVYYDDINKNIDLVSNRKSVKFYGGCLTDEVGLGKTFQMISLIISNQAQNTEYIQENYNKLCSRATLVLCPNQLCRQWERELKKMINKDYSQNIITILTKREFERYTYQDILDADIVIVSFQFFGNSNFTLLWTTKFSKIKCYHRQKWEYGEYIKILNKFNDMSQELVENALEHLTKTQVLFQLIHWHRIVVDEFHETYSINKYAYVKNILPFITASKRWIMTATPFITDNSVYENFEFITGYENFWSITNRKKLKYVLSLDQITDQLSNKYFRRNTKDSVKKEHTLPPIEDEVIWLTFSATERIMYNAYLADPNNDRYNVYLRQLCCHPKLGETKHLLSSCSTLEEIEIMMLKFHQKEVDNALLKVNNQKRKIKNTAHRIKKMKEQETLRRMKIDIESDSEESEITEWESEEDFTNILNIDSKLKTIDNYKITLERQLGKLDNLRKILDGKESKLNFYTTIVDRIRKTVTRKKSESESKYDNLDAEQLMEMIENESSDEDDDGENCGICLDMISNDNLAITNCGHIFCHKCIKDCIERTHKCPYCRKELTEKDFTLISHTIEEDIKPNNSEKMELVNKLGTKLANLIYYLRENDEHTIIFSQWDDLLRQVGKVLLDNDIKNVFCKGNCYQRDKAIREFNSDKNIKVIMLSSEQAAAGTNLTKASRVILLDPIYGKYEYRKDQERQAIGRAHRLGQKNIIKVIRFLIKDSIEEEIYMLNLKEDEEHNKKK